MVLQHGQGVLPRQTGFGQPVARLHIGLRAAKSPMQELPAAPKLGR